MQASNPRHPLFLLLQAQFISQLGSQIYDMAMLLWLYEKTGSAAAMGTAMLLCNLPESLFAPLGGSIAERMGRARAAIIADVTSGLGVAAVTLTLLGSLSLATQLAALCLGNVMLGLAGACRVPAINAILPSTVPPDKIQRATSWQGLATTGARIVGQACGGLLFSALGVAWAFAINSLSFFASAFFMRGIHLPPAPTVSGRPRTTVWGDTVQGLRLIWRTPRLRRPLLGIGVFHFCLASLPVTLPFLLKSRLSLQPRWLGLFVASYTAGIMVGLMTAGFARGQRTRLRTVGLAAAAAGGLFIVLAASGTAGLSIPCLLCTGIAIGIIVVNLMTELHVQAPEAQRAVLMGAAHAVGGSGLPIGMAVVGLLLDGLRYGGATVAASTMAVLAACGALAIASAFYLARAPHA